MTHRAVGIYLLGSLGYALMGSSRQLAGGPTSVISLMIAANVGRWRAERPLIRTDRRPFSIRRGAALPDRHKLSSEHSVITEKNMKKFGISLALVALLSSAAYVSTPARAEIGRVAVIFTKGGFVLGVGGGEGVLTLRGHHYPFTVSGVSVGFTVGASTTKLVGRALNLKGPASIEGIYSAVGGGGAVAIGGGGVQLQNTDGVILQLKGPKVGAEVSLAVAGVSIRLK